MSDNKDCKLHYEQVIINEQAMFDFGALLTQYIPLGSIIYLDGDLGAGKTTLVRGFLRALGHQGTVKSPTFTIVEPYSLDNNIVYDYNGLEYIVKQDAKLNVERNVERNKKSNEKYNESTRQSTQHEYKIKIYHFDLYRLEEPDELEYIGIRDYIDGLAISFIEWPEKGYGVIPQADIIVNISDWQQGRKIDCLALSDSGRQAISKIVKK